MNTISDKNFHAAVEAVATARVYSPEPETVGKSTVIVFEDGKYYIQIVTTDEREAGRIVAENLESEQA